MPALTSFSDGRSGHLWGPRQSRPPPLYKTDGPRISQTAVLVPFLFPMPSSIHLSPPEFHHRSGGRGHTFSILLRDLLCCTPNFVAHESVFRKRSEHNQPKMPSFPRRLFRMAVWLVFLPRIPSLPSGLHLSLQPPPTECRSHVPGTCHRAQLVTAGLRRPGRWDGLPQAGWRGPEITSSGFWRWDAQAQGPAGGTADQGPPLAW